MAAVARWLKNNSFTMDDTLQAAISIRGWQRPYLCLHVFYTKKLLLLLSPAREESALLLVTDQYFHSSSPRPLESWGQGKP